MARLAGHVARLAAARGDGADATEPGVGPVDEHDRAPVARPGREEFEAVAAARQAPRRAPGGRLEPQFAKAFEHHLAPVGGHFGEARHLRHEALGRDLDLRVRRIGDAARVVDAERNVARRAAGDIDAAQLAARPEDDAAAVGGPVHVGIDPAHRPGFLHVLVERIIDLALLSRGEVLDVKLGLGRLAPHEGDHLAIGRRRRPHRPAGTRHRREHFAAGEVVAFDVEQVGVRILGILEDRPGRDVARVVDALAVGAEDGLAQFLLVLLAGALDQQRPRRRPTRGRARSRPCRASGPW